MEKAQTIRAGVILLLIACISLVVNGVLIETGNIGPIFVLVSVYGVFLCGLAGLLLCIAGTR